MYAGIDPGKKGAIVIINDNNKIIRQFVIPLIDGEISVSALCSLISSFKGWGVKWIVLEEPSVLYGVNKTSMYKMGRTIGNIESSLACFGLGYTLVRPKAWQKVIWIDEDIVKEDPKATSLNSAMRIFPTHDNWLYGDNEEKTGRRSKIHDGIVDGALLAHYCKLINTDEQFLAKLSRKS